MGKNVYSFNEIKDVYYNQYLFNIYQLLINTNYTFQFLSLDDMILLEENVNNPLLRSDLFLENFSKDKIKLANDILSKGTYWPFIMTNNNEIVEGSHRLYSLKYFNKFYKKITSKYLCIKMPWDLNAYNNKDFLLSNIDLENPIKYYKLDENNLTLVKTETQNSYSIHKECVKISNILLNNAIFLINKKYRNFILPNQIFNSEILFNNFLKNNNF